MHFNCCLIFVVISLEPTSSKTATYLGNSQDDQISLRKKKKGIKKELSLEFHDPWKLPVLSGFIELDINCC